MGEGKRREGCPYFASRRLAVEADIVFCPYTYLVDPVVRAAMDISLTQAVVILDEAHNIEDAARSVQHPLKSYLLRNMPCCGPKKLGGQWLESADIRIGCVFFDNRSRG